MLVGNRSNMDKLKGLLASPLASIEQGSDEWQEIRYGDGLGATCSRLAAALGVHPYTSRASLMHRLQGNKPPAEMNDNMAFGIKYEDYVVMMYLDVMASLGHTGLKPFVHGFKLHPGTPHFGGSIDRLIYDTETDKVWALEVKTRPKGDYREVVPIYHKLQMVGICECYELDRCDYVCWSPSDSTVTVSTLTYDKVLWTDLLKPALTEFYEWRTNKSIVPRMKAALKRERTEFILDHVKCVAPV